MDTVHSSLTRAALGLALLAPFGAFAFSTASLPGLSTYAGGMTYTGTAAAAGGKFSTYSLVYAGGKSVSIPTTMNYAATAASAVASVVKIGTGWGAVAAVAAWLLPYGIEWANDQWQKGDPSEAVPSGGLFRDWNGAYYSSLQEACVASCPQQAAYAQTHGQAPAACVSFSHTVAPNRCYGVQASGATSNYMNSSQVSDCPSGYYWSGSACVSGTPGASPVTESDWAEVAAQPLPDAVADVVADTVAIPVQAPQMEPVVEPISEPYRQPDGTVVRDIVSVIPSPTIEDPLRVDIKTGTEVMDPATPTQVTDPDVQLDKPNPFCSENPDAWACKRIEDFCQVYPDTIGCSTTEPPEDVDLTEQEPDVVVTPSPGFASDGSCPAPQSLALHGATVAFDYAPMCQFAQGVRPVVLAAAWLTAALLVVYGFRRA